MKPGIAARGAFYAIAAAVACALSAIVFIKAQHHFERIEYRLLRTDEIDADTAGYAWKGTDTAAMSAVAYTDIECAQYAAFARMLDSLLQLRDIRIYYKLRPLSRKRSLHIRTHAAYAALRQGQFFEMLNLLDDISISHSRKVDKKNLFARIYSCADSLGLDVQQVKSDMHSEEIRTIAGNVIDETEQCGIITFPCLLINGRLVRGVVPVRDVVQVADIVP